MTAAKIRSSSNVLSHLLLDLLLYFFPLLFSLVLCLFHPGRFIHSPFLLFLLYFNGNIEFRDSMMKLPPLKRAFCTIFPHICLLINMCIITFYGIFSQAPTLMSMQKCTLIPFSCTFFPVMKIIIFSIHIILFINDII